MEAKRAYPAALRRETQPAYQRAALERAARLRVELPVEPPCRCAPESTPEPCPPEPCPKEPCLKETYSPEPCPKEACPPASGRPVGLLAGLGTEELLLGGLLFLLLECRADRTLILLIAYVLLAG